MPAFDSDERQLLHESLQDYFAAQYPFEHFRALSHPEHEDGFGRSDWTQYAQLGWLGVALPEEAGGAGGGTTELGIIMAAAGAALAFPNSLAVDAEGNLFISDSFNSRIRGVRGPVGTSLLSHSRY